MTFHQHQALTLLAGLHFAIHFRRRRRVAGAYATARQMRKQGWSLPVALLVLTRLT